MTKFSTLKHQNARQLFNWTGQHIEQMRMATYHTRLVSCVVCLINRDGCASLGLRVPNAFGIQYRQTVLCSKLIKKIFTSSGKFITLNPKDS
jgi:hypothetical protein